MNIFQSVATVSVLLILICCYPLKAQDPWNFPEPTVAAGPYAITDTVYMSPTGNDTASGTQNNPVATFSKALQLLPFGTPGINGGRAYGLVRLLPGTYFVTGGMQQPASQYKQGNTYKNVSIEGIDEVYVQGKQDTFAPGHLVLLRGSHIFVKNLKLRYGNIHGVFFPEESPRINNILIENVEVDSVRSFGMLFRECDTLLVRHAKALNSSRPGFDTLTTGPDCSWPSGIKFYGCKWSVIHDSEIAYTRGEGLNFHNSEYGLAYNNSLHDNPTNLYCDNSARIVIRNNFNYAIEGNTRNWRTCPADTFHINGSNGILLANEGACSIGGPVYQNCRTMCNLLGRSYPNIDSIFIHNNVFINTTPALSLWQGVTEVLQGYNCLRNIFFYHNTIVGVVGDPTANNTGMIHAFFPNFHNTAFNLGFATVENFHVYGNIISYDYLQYPKVQIARVVLDNLLPSPFQMITQNNRLIKPDVRFSSSDLIDSTMPMSVAPVIDSVLHYLQPDSGKRSLLQFAPATPWVIKDYLYQKRKDTTNIGALEFREDSVTTGNTAISRYPSSEFTIYPNPVDHSLVIHSEYSASKPAKVTCLDISGRILWETPWPVEKSQLTLPVSTMSAGFYMISISSPEGTMEVLRFVKH